MEKPSDFLLYPLMFCFRTNCLRIWLVFGLLDILSKTLKLLSASISYEWLDFVPLLHYYINRDTPNCTDGVGVVLK